MKKQAVQVKDGAYENLVTGLGQKSIDKSANIKATPYMPAKLSELASMKVQDGIASFIVDGVPEAALMKDITIIGDGDGKALKLASKLGLFRALKNAGSEMRLTGGAIVVTEYEGDSAQTISEEPSKKAKVEGYRVFSAGKVDLKNSDFEGENPKFFTITLIDGTPMKVHPSRCTVFHGARLPDILEGVSLRERYFGVSALYPVEQSLKELAAVSGAIVNMAQETGTLIMRLSNLNMMLSKPDCGTEDIHKLLSLLKLCMNSMRAGFAGKDDGFDIMSHNFAGLPEVWTKSMALVSARSRIPMSILFGQSATGLAQTNEGDIKAWCQLVEMWRTNYMYEGTARLIADLTARNHTAMFEEFEWGAVDEMSLKELLEARKLQAETLDIYFKDGSLYPDEMRKSVFQNGHSWEVTIDD